MDLDSLYEDTKQSMGNSVESLKKEYSSIRTGKASTKMLEGIKVPYYDNPTPLSQVATILVVDATTISITPWEKHLVGAISKSIQEANIGANPNNDGDSVKLFLPPMTNEQRKDSVKRAKSMTDNFKVAIRNIRRDSNDKIKRGEKDKELTKDESIQAQGVIQKITDEHIGKLDGMLSSKEQDIMKI